MSDYIKSEGKIEEIIVQLKFDTKKKIAMVELKLITKSTESYGFLFLILH